MKKRIITGLAVLGFIPASVLLLWATVQKDNAEQTVTAYPPALYMRPFIACTGDKPCTQADEFRVNTVPRGCCVLTVTNGDGRGTDEVSGYEVFLNGQRVVPAGRARYAQAAVKVLPRRNTLKVVLVGKPHSKVFIMVAFDPRQSK